MVLSLLLSIIYEKFYETTDLMGGEVLGRKLEYRVGGENIEK